MAGQSRGSGLMLRVIKAVRGGPGDGDVAQVGRAWRRKERRDLGSVQKQKLSRLV